MSESEPEFRKIPDGEWPNTKAFRQMAQAIGLRVNIPKPVLKGREGHMLRIKEPLSPPRHDVRFLFDTDAEGAPIDRVVTEELVDSFTPAEILEKFDPLGGSTTFRAAGYELFITRERQEHIAQTGERPDLNATLEDFLADS